MAIDLIDKQYRQIIIRGNNPLIIDFIAEGIGSYRLIGPTIGDVLLDFDEEEAVEMDEVEPSLPVFLIGGESDGPSILYYKDHQVVEKQTVDIPLTALVTGILKQILEQE